MNVSIADLFCLMMLSKVGTVVSVTEFESDKLYCCLVTTGDAQPKQVSQLHACFADASATMLSCTGMHSH